MTDLTGIVVPDAARCRPGSSATGFGLGYLFKHYLLDVPANKDDNSIVRAIIAMAHSLGQMVVGEGVEEFAQLDFLKQHHCDIIQGYYFSKPLNKADFAEFLASQNERDKQYQSG